jgi:hypothetical protein
MISLVKQIPFMPYGLPRPSLRSIPGIVYAFPGSYSSGSRSCSLRFFGSPVIASASASRCCGSRASLASRYVHGTFF